MTFWTCHLLVGLQEAKSAAARMEWLHGSVRTRVGSEPRSDVTPTCSLRIGEHDSRRQTRYGCLKLGEAKVAHLVTVNKSFL